MNMQVIKAIGILVMMETYLNKLNGGFVTTISDSFNNILDYYSAWSSYQAQMESWKTSGQVNTSSFVDLLAHVSQVAQKTGKDIQFLGQTFDKSGLINGMTLDNLQSTLVSAVRSDKKGNTFLDTKILSQLGWNMQAGAEAIAGIYGDLDAYWQPTFEQAEEWNKFADSMNAVERAMNKIIGALLHLF